MNPRILCNILLLLAFIAGCGGSRSSFYPPSPDQDKNPDQSVVFPHNLNWVEPSAHGKFVLDSGTTACKNACHGENLEGGGARACKTCHSIYPHRTPDVWQGLLGHGKFVRENGGANACATKCHGADLAGGYDPAGKKSCIKCHASYPNEHTETEWKLKGHGLFAASAGSSNECTTMCHRSDAPEGLKLKVCADCHKSYPAPHAGADWKGAGHKGFLSTHGGIVASDCTTCHGQKLEGSSEASACATSACHHPGPEDRWKDGAVHGPAATSAVSKCLACHGSDLKGNSVIKGCDECHHKNWADTHAKPWAAISEHGRQGAEPATSCKFCHGNDLSGGLSGISCRTCHDLYPHTVDWVDPDPSKEKHGLVARGGMERCVSCHGDVRSPDCKSCHHDNKGADWRTALHQAGARSNIAGCKACHGDDLQGGRSGRSCYDCHDPAGKYPHPSGWEGKFRHGLQYIQDQYSRSYCQTACHGTDLAGGLSGVPCKQCHTEYPHPPDPVWLSAHRAKVLTPGDDLDLTAFNNKCAVCHGPVYTQIKGKYPSTMTPAELKDVQWVTDPGTGATVIKRCYICHFAYPHVDGKTSATGQSRPWLDAHYMVTGSDWGYPSDTCSAGGNACHRNGRKGSPVKASSTYCKSYCHR